MSTWMKHSAANSQLYTMARTKGSQLNTWMDEQIQHKSTQMYHSGNYACQDTTVLRSKFRPFQQCEPSAAKAECHKTIPDPIKQNNRQATFWYLVHYCDMGEPSYSYSNWAFTFSVSKSCYWRSRHTRRIRSHFLSKNWKPSRLRLVSKENL